MKKMIAATLLLIMLFGVEICNAEISREELSVMSIEQLLSLQENINQILQEKGYAVYTDISHGEKGDHVVKLQERLKAFGYYSGKISGKYDTITEKSVKQFQKDNGLEVSGVATVAFQEKLYSMDMSSLTTATPKPTVEPKSTENSEYSAYLVIDYSECARYPERYQGSKAKIEGKVLQVIGTKEKGFTIRLAVSSGSNDVYYIKIKRGIVDYNILENDRLIVYGRMNGLYTYTSTFGQSITIPHAIADAVILR